MKSEANNTQIAGDHYKCAYQHWDMTIDFEMPYLLSAATKYLTRRKASRAEDVNKARHYMAKQLESFQSQSMNLMVAVVSQMSKSVVEGNILHFCKENRLSVAEYEIMMAIVTIKTRQDLQEAILLVDQLIRAEKLEPPVF